MTERLASADMWSQYELPAQDQLNEYVELIRDITHSVGRGVKRRRATRAVGSGDTITDVSNKEFWLPGTLTHWSAPDAQLRTQQERSRTYSVSYLSARLGQGARQLVVLEHDSIRFTDHAGKAKYHTNRNMYRLNWLTDGTVTHAKMIRGEIVSNAVVDATVRGTEIDEANLWLDHEETDPDLFRFFEPMELSDVEFDSLLRRTDEYGQAIVQDIDNRRAIYAANTQAVL